MRISEDVVFRQNRKGIAGTGGAGARPGLALPGVGLPRGRGRLILSDSEGLSNQWLTNNSQNEKKSLTLSAFQWQHFLSDRTTFLYYV